MDLEAQTLGFGHPNLGFRTNPGFGRPNPGKYVLCPDLPLWFAWLRNLMA